MFRLLEFYLRELAVNQATEVLFIADGATWIWHRVTKLWQRLGLIGIRCWELVDFYHVVEHVYALAALNTSWRKSRRKRWATQQRRRLWRGELKAFTAEVERLCRGKRGKGWAANGTICCATPARGVWTMPRRVAQKCPSAAADGERGSPRGQLAAQRSGHLLARGTRRANAVIADVLQVETLASPDEQSICDPTDKRRLAPMKPKCSRISTPLTPRPTLAPLPS